MGLEGLFRSRRWSKGVLCGGSWAGVLLFPACPRCTCTSSSGAWPTSTPRVCVTATSSPRTCWWTLTPLSSSSAILAGGPDLGYAGWLKGARRDPEPRLVSTPAHLFPQCKAVGPGGAQCLLHLFSLLSGPGADLWSHRLHLIHRSDLREGGGGNGSHGCF